MDKTLFKILVVDDEQDVRDVLAKYLPRKLNVEVRACADGFKAVEQAKAFKPDLVLLDMHLPGHMGWDVLREIREFDAAVKIVFITAVDIVPQEDQELILQQTSGYLTKPLNLDEISRMIVRVLGQGVVK